MNTLFIEPGSPWENRYIESFNRKLRDELLNREVFTTLIEVKILIEEWRKEYNHVRPHSALNYRPPSPQATYSVDSNLTGGAINGGRSGGSVALRQTLTPCIPTFLHDCIIAQHALSEAQEQNYNPHKF